ncbi:hypothetical protein MRX96_003938 [Rhipicephalus microplus]
MSPYDAARDFPAAQCRDFRDCTAHMLRGQRRRLPSVQSTRSLPNMENFHSFVRTVADEKGIPQKSIHRRKRLPSQCIPCNGGERDTRPLRRKSRSRPAAFASSSVVALGAPPERETSPAVEHRCKAFPPMHDSFVARYGKLRRHSNCPVRLLRK